METPIVIISDGTVVKRNALLGIVVAALALTVSIPAYALNFFTDRASWEAALPASFAPVDIASQVPEHHTLPAGSALLLPFGETLRFDIRMLGLQVPSSWASWSDSEKPAILFTGVSPPSGAASFNGTFGAQPVVAYGLELEPNHTETTFTFTLTTTDGTSQSISQSAFSPFGVKFFGWTGDATSMQISCSANCDGEGFAIANLVLGGFSGTPRKSNCHDQSVSALAQKYGGMDHAAETLGFPSVSALQNAIKAYCGS
jgi:hypothetical protein